MREEHKIGDSYENDRVHFKSPGHSLCHFCIFVPRRLVLNMKGNVVQGPFQEVGLFGSLHLYDDMTVVLRSAIHIEENLAVFSMGRPKFFIPIY